MLLRTSFQICSRSNGRIVPITWKGVCTQQWDKADVHLQHYGMWEHTEGIFVISLINGNVINFCEGEFNSCVREVYRVGRYCWGRTAILYYILDIICFFWNILQLRVMKSSSELFGFWLPSCRQQESFWLFYERFLCSVQELGLSRWSSFSRRSS